MNRLSILLILTVLCTMARAFDEPKQAAAQADQRAYVLGPGDQITVHATDAEGLADRSVRIGTNGDINLPLAGRIHAGGLTVEQLEEEVGTRLQVFIKEPDVTISITEMRSQPVSVIGAVNNPGVHQLEGRKTLVEMLSAAGGLKEDASYDAELKARNIVWGPIPLANARMDSSGQFSIAEIPLHDIFAATNPADNILIMPNDIINVPRAQMVYVIGDVNRAGSIVLGGQKSITVLQAIAIAAGPGKTAKAASARILRLTSGTANRTEVAVNLKAMLTGKTGDVEMEPEDILFVPTSLPKDMGFRTLEALAGTGATSVIYRLP